MGKHAFNAGAYARAVEWFEESYILAGLENNKTIRQDQVMEFIQHAINMVFTFNNISTRDLFVMFFCFFLLHIFISLF